MPKTGKLTGGTNAGTRSAPPEPVLLDGRGVRVLDDAIEFVDPSTGASDLRLSRGPGGYLRGALPQVDHDWTVHGWSDFRAVTISADGAQVFTPSVSAGKGIITAASSSAANLRVAYLREGTTWADSEVRSTIYGPTADWNGVNAQQGHLHRVSQRSDGSWQGIAVWTSIVLGGDYGYLHANAVNFNGTTLLQANGPDTTFGPFGYGDSAYIDHRLQVIGISRQQPLLWVNDYRVHRPQLITIAATDIVDIAGFTDGTFNETGIAIQSIVDLPSGVVRVTEPVSTNTVAYVAVKSGTITPSGVDINKRYCPYVLATRVVGGSASSITVQGKRWRLDEGEPDWGDARVQVGEITPSANVATLPTAAGRCGLWAAHFHQSSGGAWGPARFKQVT